MGYFSRFRRPNLEDGLNGASPPEDLGQVGVNDGTAILSYPVVAEMDVPSDTSNGRKEKESSVKPLEIEKVTLEYYLQNPGELEAFKKWVNFLVALENNITSQSKYIEKEWADINNQEEWKILEKHIYKIDSTAQNIIKFWFPKKTEMLDEMFREIGVKLGIRVDAINKENREYQFKGVDELSNRLIAIAYRYLALVDESRRNAINEGYMEANPHALEFPS